MNSLFNTRIRCINDVLRMRARHKYEQEISNELIAKRVCIRGELSYIALLPIVFLFHVCDVVTFLFTLHSPFSMRFIPLHIRNENVRSKPIDGQANERNDYIDNAVEEKKMK